MVRHLAVSATFSGVATYNAATLSIKQLLFKSCSVSLAIFSSPHTYFILLFSNQILILIMCVVKGMVGHTIILL
jgi:hypothetical protein